MGITGPATDIPINNYYYAGMIAAILMSAVMAYQALSFVLTGRNGPTWAYDRDQESVS